MIRNFTDHANNERTFLSWVRLTITIVGFGLATARISNVSVPFWSDILLFGSGAILVLLAFLRMIWLRKRIEQDELLDDGGVAADALLILVVVALLAVFAAFAYHVAL
ncbi:MAG: DUF202 domain-containing protein [Nitratireductor sp.]|jgi:putative membrane protein|nr:DUF202 domain-containing protein [Nitratireductor sp.]